MLSMSSLRTNIPVRLWAGIVLMVVTLVCFLIGLQFSGSMRLVMLLGSVVPLVLGYILIEQFIHFEQTIKRVIVGLAATATIVLGLIPLLPNNEPVQSMDSCLSQVNQDSDAESALIDSLYCKTQYANIWQPRPPVMYDDNKPLAIEHYSPMTNVLRGNAEPNFLASTLANPDIVNLGLKMSDIYERWPNYEHSTFSVIGRITAKNKQPGGDWVFQIGTVRSGNEVIYVRLLRPDSWTPQPAEKCQLALVEMVPIARGTVPSAESGQLLDAIYGLGTNFWCGPVMSQDEADKLMESMTPEERKAFEEGGSQDSF